MRGHIRWIIALIALGAQVTPQAFAQHARDNLRVDADRIERRIQALAAFGRNPDGGNSRVAFSEADVQGRDYIISLMREAGLSVRIDAAGNIIGRREGSDPNLPSIAFGSHIDAVPRGGNYDGDVGVIGAIECAHVLHEHDVVTRHGLEVIVFSDEEGGLVGSRAMVGELSPEALDVISHSGKTIRDGIRFIGGDPDRVNSPSGLAVSSSGGRPTGGVSQAAGPFLRPPATHKREDRYVSLQEQRCTSEVRRQACLSASNEKPRTPLGRSGLFIRLASRSGTNRSSRPVNSRN